MGETSYPAHEETNIAFGVRSVSEEVAVLTFGGGNLQADPRPHHDGVEAGQGHEHGAEGEARRHEVGEAHQGVGGVAGDSTGSRW